MKISKRVYVDEDKCIAVEPVKRSVLRLSRSMKKLKEPVTKSKALICWSVASIWT
jgi:hypothetical protein